ncbi:Zinc finger RING-type [Penicillium coprophilum]|uniref:Zinc finger RING-type n=1 Tax=Penicillium coprophilum TaxID=36646 RepID=UPI0023964076|nr:Zinc finger RING-type [Penicillium coprophilum]KAJ5178576.1 Zinc finger RING-type [Penicillium coprophilum]
MDFSLRCNSLKCRAELKEKAVVTTCSHVFCHACAESLGLSRPTTSSRHCPACQTVLLNPDDAVSTILNPTEDYKTSVLSGLDPNTIMECAGRALAFWAYQSTQEIFYQEYRAKTLTEKYANLNTQMDKVIHNANTEILSLQNKLSDMQSTQEDLQKKNQELNDMYRDKNNKLAQMTNLYNLLKARAMRSRMQTAASDTVSQALSSLNAPPPVSVSRPDVPARPSAQVTRHPKTPTFPVNPDGVEQLHRYQRSGTGSSKRARTRTPREAPMPPPVRPNWDGRNSRGPDLTLQHRTRLPRISRPPAVSSEFPPGDAIMQRFGS